MNTINIEESPVGVFKRNLERWGFTFRVEAGRLIVRKPDSLSVIPEPLVKEIAKRKTYLMMMVELDGLLDRPLFEDEAERCRQLAAALGVELEWTHNDFRGDGWRPGRHRDAVAA